MDRIEIASGGSTAVGETVWYFARDGKLVFSVVEAAYPLPTRYSPGRSPVLLAGCALLDPMECFVRRNEAITYATWLAQHRNDLAEKLLRQVQADLESLSKEET